MTFGGLAQKMAARVPRPWQDPPVADPTPGDPSRTQPIRLVPADLGMPLLLPLLWARSASAGKRFGLASLRW